MARRLRQRPSICCQEGRARLENPELIMALSRLARRPARTTAFLEILNTIGSPLIAQIVATYRESSSEGMSSRRAPEPRALARTAAG